MRSNTHAQQRHAKRDADLYDDFCSGVNNVSAPDARHHDGPVFVRDDRLCLARCAGREFECGTERVPERLPERGTRRDVDREEG